MKLSEAIDEMERIYIPGAIAHYERINPDPWQRANDEMERDLVKGNPSLAEVAVERWIFTMRALLERFRQEGQPSEPISLDAFMMGSRWNETESTEYLVCAKCGSGMDLSPCLSPESGRSVMFCRKCKPSLQGARQR